MQHFNFKASLKPQKILSVLEYWKCYVILKKKQQTALIELELDLRIVTTQSLHVYSVNSVPLL